MRKKETKKRPTFLFVLEAAPFSEWPAVCVNNVQENGLFYISTSEMKGGLTPWSLDISQPQSH